MILDGHGSYSIPKLDETCSQNDAIPIYKPAHSLHLLQPLGVVCFAVLKRAYVQLVETKMRAGINHFDKFDFLEAYCLLRTKAFKVGTIIDSFTASGLVPFDPDRVKSGVLGAKKVLRLRAISK